jgi:hypothetical protein
MVGELCANGGRCSKSLACKAAMKEWKPYKPEAMKSTPQCCYGGRVPPAHGVATDSSNLPTRRRRSGGSASKCARRERSLTLPPPMVGQTCRFAPISPPASAAMLAEPWGYARQNIAPLVLVKVWAARQRRPTLVVSSCARPALPGSVNPALLSPPFCIYFPID